LHGGHSPELVSCLFTGMLRICAQSLDRLNRWLWALNCYPTSRSSCQQIPRLLQSLSRLMALRYRDQRVGFTVAIGGAADKGRLAAFAGCVENDPYATLAPKICCDAQPSPERYDALC
jgi:hypothetical protein